MAIVVGIIAFIAAMGGFLLLLMDVAGTMTKFQQSFDSLR